MGLAKIWDIVWDNSLFHWATAIVVFIAVCVELYTVWQYWKSDCGITGAAVKSLKNPKQKEDRSIRRWKQEHLQINNEGAVVKQDNKYILIKYPEVLLRPVPRSSLRFVTTLCTAIGVLGTFYGIQEGLQGINLETSSSEQLMASSKELLVGMKTAFSTSLMGLGSGSFFTLVLFFCESLRQKRRDDLRKQLSIATVPIAANNDSKEVALQLSQVASKLDNISAEAIGDAVGKSIAEQLQGLQQLSSTAIGEAVGRKVLPALQEIYKEQKQIRELQQNQGQRVLEQLIRDLRVDLIEPLAQKLDDSANLTREASQAVQKLHQELGGITTSLASSIVTIQNFQEKTLGDLQNFAENLKNTLSTFQSETKGVLEQTGAEINRAVEKSIQGMELQRTAFEESANEAANTFRGIREELQTALQQRAEIEKQMLQETHTKITDILAQANTAFREQTNTLTTVGNEASQFMNSAKENLVDTLTATREVVQDDLTKFRQEYQINLQNFFETQNNLLENTLGQQRNGLAEVVENLDKTFKEEASRRSELTKEVDQTFIKLHKAAEEVNRLAIASGLHDTQRLTQLQLFSQDIGTQIQIVNNSYSEMASTFRETLQDWKNHFAVSRENFFSKADSAMADVCSELLKTANFLVDVNDNRNIMNRGN
ncbi:hypothetical protein NIES4071_85140 [Calothrix sp. NIES-4071]|nr:hypothetical protein NIES4071_85140 [Calothrix sp. NIES-4071]BAZ62781.1 hypothetical protein NIES4105_85070 [Calothrix sp. NIES-4105]